ncbi:glycoside hydrolase family 104 protein [Aminobacter anthyllidis]|uniref:Glycoside hydrolase family 104 protein n=1 Tax=Aminobacter anthyllidis TaxID=1035067 RepID=A0A9X1D5J8_9HYPH|nr:glycoside hydrolase family 104 protein [Aminobacter anthyllidis]MBT1155733.1 glycoside hydrolase family 104 protein [Aminobacter anthyllidis]
MALSFIFDASKETPASLAKKRAVADALASRNQVPRNVGEGISALADGVVAAVLGSRADAGEKAGRDHAATTMAQTLGAGAFPDAPPSKPSASTSSAPIDYKGDELAWADAQPYQKALLNTIAGPESGGRYDIIYGGGRFDDFSKHPGQAVRIQTGPNAGRTSSAAGKYQFLGSTWEDQAGKLGLTDFSPANQDKAAWNLAAETYKAKTGQDLDGVLQSGDPTALAKVGQVLNPIWTSLPGGIEQGTNTDRFVATYQRALNAGASPTQAKQVAQVEQAQPVQVASLDPSAGVTRATARPMPEEYANIGLSQDAWSRMNEPTGSAPSAATASPAQPPGEVRKGPDGQTYQYAETTGMAGASGSQGWIRVNAPQTAQPVAAATTPAAQRVLSAMMSQEPMGGAPAAISGAASRVTGALEKVAPGNQQAAGSPGTQRVAQALGGGAEAYRGTAIDSDMPGHEPLQPGEAGPSIQQLMQAASDPWLNEQQRALVNTMLEQKMQSADPIRRLQIQKLQKELGTPQKQWQKLDDNTLFDPATGETKSIGKTGTDAFRFQGNSVEAQSLNGLMDSGALTPEQAQQLGAGKTVTGPNGETIFMTPQGVFGQATPGGPAMPITPQAAPAPSSPAVPTPGPAPAPSIPPAPAQSQRPGMIPITDPKPVRATEAQRNRSSNVDQAFSTITNELDRYEKLVGETGIEAKPGQSKDNLNTVRQGIMLQMKELFNLGVLNGPDLSLMERMIYDPVVDPLKEGGIANLPDQIWTGITGGAGERAKNSVAELKRMLTNIKESVGKSVDQPGAPAPTDTGGWKDMGNGVKIRVKQ